MKAALQKGYGSLEVVELGDVDRPVPADDQVLVRVRAASVNRADLEALGPRPAFARSFMGLRAPRNPRMGIDVAGVVEAIGSAVTRFRPGDEVFADLFSFGGGTFAEYVCARETAFQTIPAGMSFEVASTLPHSAILALQGLRLRGGRRTVRPGDKVLIDGASGNASGSACDRTAPTSPSVADRGASSRPCSWAWPSRAARAGWACCCGGSRSTRPTSQRSSSSSPRARSHR
jgi:NADPH:quinone reductase-like Zn-dependent oxidoreductase